MSAAVRGLWFCLLAWTLAFSPLCAGTSLREWQDAGHLQVDSALSPRTGIVPGQRVVLTLEIATDTWFTGGTRISIPEVPGLVILQTEQFASNASETRNGDSWVVQRWTLDVFPQRAGDFTIGRLPLKVQVNAGEAGNIAGELHSPPQQFRVTVPESLAQAEHWVAAPAFSVSQSFDRSLEGLVVGDAFEHEVRFEATDVLAMMLPGYDAEPQDGLGAYPSPPKLDNSNNRGQSLASRSVRISYVVEQPGHYRLPARDYYWWNTNTGKLALLTLPETRIDVAGSAAAAPATPARIAITPRQWLLAGAGLALMIAGTLLARYLLPRLPVARWRGQLSALLHRLRGLFRPALATRLNPGSSSGE